ncbi:unnamed protein product, partial [marine sediment metagenome]
IISYCVVTNTANSGIAPGLGNTGSIDHNIVSKAMQLLNDGGGIYAFHQRTSNNPFTNFVIEYNFVSDIPLVAINNQCIYLDNRVKGNIIRYNTLYNTLSSGILVNADTEENTLTNNTVFRCQEGVNFRDWAAPSEIYDLTMNVLNDNILVSGIAADTNLSVVDLANPYANGGGADRNYYVNPYEVLIAKANTTEQTLAQVRTAYSQDVNSSAVVNYRTIVDPDND